MKKNNLLKIVFFFSITFLFSSNVFGVAADTSTTNEVGITKVVCDTLNSNDPKCLPPTLGDLQTTMISLIGTVYSLVGVLFLGILIYNGLIYLIGNLEDAKFLLGASIEDAQKRMVQWLTGFMMVLLSYPLVNGFMQLIVGESDCYNKLNNPTVQFVFPEVCKLDTTTTPTVTP